MADHKEKLDNTALGLGKPNFRETNPNDSSTPLVSALKKKPAPPIPVAKTLPDTTNNVSRNDKLEVKRPCTEHNFLTDVCIY